MRGIYANIFLLEARDLARFATLNLNREFHTGAPLNGRGNGQNEKIETGWRLEGAGRSGRNAVAEEIKRNHAMNEVRARLLAKELNSDNPIANEYGARQLQGEWCVWCWASNHEVEIDFETEMRLIWRNAPQY